MERFFSFNLISDGKLDKDDVYLFGFHPHGIYPLTCFTATRGKAWREKIGIDVDILGATIMFLAPILRDILLWAGGRDGMYDDIIYAV
jgi:Diacylglycerol acyltransferase